MRNEKFHCDPKLDFFQLLYFYLKIRCERKHFLPKAITPLYKIYCDRENIDTPDKLSTFAGIHKTSNVNDTKTEVQTFQYRS